MLNSILFFLYALAYSIYVLFLSICCIFMFMGLMAGIITIACYIQAKIDEKQGKRDA